MGNPTLPLTTEEKIKLRKENLKLSEIYTLSHTRLAEILTIPEERAQEITALAEFQSLPSIGHQLAHKLVKELRLFSLIEIRDQDGALLFDLLEKRLGVWTDSCVEDQIRCVIHHANHPGSSKQWYDFTKERKKHRDASGYPDDRPTKAWYE
jgi:hypothetical protein